MATVREPPRGPDMEHVHSCLTFGCPVYMVCNRSGCKKPQLTPCPECIAKKRKESAHV